MAIVGQSSHRIAVSGHHVFYTHREEASEELEVNIHLTWATRNTSRLCLTFLINNNSEDNKAEMVMSLPDSN